MEELLYWRFAFVILLCAQLYQGSVVKAISSVFPEHGWAHYKFIYIAKYPENWKDEELKDIMNWMEKKLGIKQPEDWYSTSLVQIRYSIFICILNIPGL